MKNFKKVLAIFLTALLVFGTLSVSFNAFAATKVSKITLSKTKATVYATKTIKLKATVSPSKATVKTVKWSSSNNKVATVSSKGVVKGVKAGTATITAAATDGSGKKATCKVTVKKFVKITSVSLPKTKTVYIGKTDTFTATIKPSGASIKTLKWTSSNKKVATVTQKGVVKGVKAGTVTITAAATDGSGKKATCKVTVKKFVKVTGVTLNASSKTVYTGKSVTLKATVKPSTASIKTLSWTSSNKKVATVSQKGVVKGVKAGTATITAAATDGSGKKVTCKVTVKNKLVTAIDVKLAASQIYPGETTTVSAVVTPSDATKTAVKWTSSNDSVATVDTEGNVRAVKSGETNIIATAQDGSKVTGSAKLVVATRAASIQILSPTKSWYVGKKAQLYVEFTPENTTNKKVTWTSSKPAVASVDSNGVVTILKYSRNSLLDSDCTVKITATAKDGSNKSSSIEIKVPEKKVNVSSIAFNSMPSSFYVGETGTFSVTVKPDDASEKAVIYSSSDPSVINVTENGHYTVLKVGTATITAKSADQTVANPVTQTANVSVVPITYSFSYVTPEREYYPVNTSGQIHIRAYAGENVSNPALRDLGVNYTISDESVVSVSRRENSYNFYNVQYLKPGTAKVTFKNNNGDLIGEMTFVVRGIFSESYLYENVKAGDKVRLNTYVTDGSKVDSDPIEFTIPQDYWEYFDIDTENNSVDILKEVPTGAYVNVTNSRMDLSAKIYFTSSSINTPSGDKSALLNQMKTVSQSLAAKKGTKTKTVEYTDTVVDNNKSSMKMNFRVTTFIVPLLIPFETDLSGLLDRIESSGQADDSDVDELVDEMSVENMIGTLFEGKNSDYAFEEALPGPITVDENDVASVVVTPVDHASSDLTYTMTLNLNKQSKTDVKNMKSSSYGKTMPVVDNDYISKFENDYAQDINSDEMKLTEFSCGTVNAVCDKGYVTYTFNAITNEVIKAEYHYNTGVDVSNARAGLTMNIDEDIFAATMTTKIIAYFTTDADVTTVYTDIA